MSADTVDTMNQLATLLEREREGFLARWRQQVRELPSARHLDTPTLNDHIPALLKDLAAALRSPAERTIPESLREGGPPAHGLQRLQDAFDLEEVVAEYNILRGCVHDLADDNGLVLQGRPFHVVNHVLDLAIGLAVQAYSTARALEVQRRRAEYLAFVAHDLRTPLQAISLAGRVLEVTLPERGFNAEAVRMLKAQRRNVLQLETLISKVLEEHANLQTEIGISLERRELDLWSLVEGLIHDLHPVAGTASTQMINNVPEELFVYADAGLLKRIFQNLIANAIRYTPRGEVVIGARPLDDQAAVECWISDNGAGIPEELVEKVFDKGETDSDNVGGSGLGLAIVRTFTEAHGGSVNVESKEGVGSTFRFTLPAK